MKTFILLRNNKEYGPYTQKQLKDFGLLQNDLIWIEGESAAWEHPTGIRGLKAIAKGGIKSPLPAEAREAINTKTEVSPATDYSVNENYLAISERQDQPYHFYKKQNSIRTSVSHFFGLTVLLIGVILCAFVVKKMVDGFGYENDAISQAKEISSETLALSASSSNTAKETGIASAAPLNVENVTIKKDSIQKQIIAKKPLVHADKSIVAVDNPIGTAAQVVQNDVTKKEVTEAAIKTEEKPEPTPAVMRTSSLQVSTNDYKVGLFGGISDLELSVSNASSVAVDKAIVEVEFLKPNGSVVKSQTFSVENISPGGSKKITVPSSNRGVKVRYRVVNVAGKQVGPSENNS